MLFRRRLFLSIVAGLAVALVNYIIHASFAVANDIEIPHCAAGRLLTGQDPYSCSTNGMASNPLTTVLFFVPLAGLPASVAGALVSGGSVGLLAWALNREGEPWRLLALLSVPLIYSVQLTQWAPLFLAAAYLTWLYPVALLKPQLGLPVGVMQFGRRRAVLTLALGLTTFLVLPDWLARWWSQAQGYDGFVPLWVLPGALLALALLRWRTVPARWLLLLSVMPQRDWYDSLLLWTIPRNGRQTLILTALSWLMWLPTLVWGRGALGEWERPWQIVTLYLPCLVFVLMQPAERRAADEASRSASPRESA